jgi:hypothetical protein
LLGALLLGADVATATASQQQSTLQTNSNLKVVLTVLVVQSGLFKPKVLQYYNETLKWRRRQKAAVSNRRI